MKKLLCSVLIFSGIILTVACSLSTKEIDQEWVSENTEYSGDIEFNAFRMEETDEIAMDPVYAEKIDDRLVDSKDFSSDEIYLLAKIAMAEAEGESTDGKALVILVVLNRVLSDAFPDTIEDVLFERTHNGVWQFSPMEDSGRWYTTEPNDDCYEAVKKVMEGWDESRGALYFESSDDPTWHSTHLEFLFKDGKHKFYK